MIDFSMHRRGEPKQDTIKDIERYELFEVLRKKWPQKQN